MGDRNREARREKVLDIIVRFYIDSIEPIGSKAVSDQMELSSATIRNIMSDLERSGFIHQPHTSSGRIPTEKGYRFYVNFLMEPEDISLREKRRIESIYQLESKSLEDIIEESSHILSYISSLAAVVMFPRANEDKLYFDGTHYILEQPEFKDSDKINSLFRALDERKVLLDIFKEDLYIEGPRVRIGSENRRSLLNQYSIITANYTMQGDNIGIVGVIGPTRMGYSKLIPIVDCLSKTMSNFLDKSV